MEKKFSLKDFLFNRQKVEQLARELKVAYPKFEEKEFIDTVLAKFPQLELKERISWISENIRKFLPDNFRIATTIILKSLPPPNDNTKSDNDFGDFIYAPYSGFVATYGCNEKDLHFSLKALKKITMRFSAEDAIRYFINAFPNETLKTLQLWSNDNNYHVRRLVSEGTRPKLPWAQKISIPLEKSLPILNNLFPDKTRYVTRSVANHLNDISKIDPKLVIRTLSLWQKSEKQQPKEMEYIINHSLRTLVKKGDKDAIKFLNFSLDPKITLSNFTIKHNPVSIGGFLEFELRLIAKEDERLFIDYILYFWSKADHNNNKKVFKLKQLVVKKDEKIAITKRHRLIGGMTTRKLYPGEHIVEIQINGKKMARKQFELVA